MMILLMIMRKMGWHDDDEDDGGELSILGLASPQEIFLSILTLEHVPSDGS